MLMGNYKIVMGMYGKARGIVSNTVITVHGARWALELSEDTL